MDGLILHTCEREGPSHWQYHKAAAYKRTHGDTCAESMLVLLDTICLSGGEFL
jgi:hypothetical protein